MMYILYSGICHAGLTPAGCEVIEPSGDIVLLVPSGNVRSCFMSNDVSKHGHNITVSSPHHAVVSELSLEPCRD